MSFLNDSAANLAIKSEIANLLKNIAEERVHYYENKIVTDLALECSNDCEINTTLGNKINSIIMDSEIMKSIVVVPNKCSLINPTLFKHDSLEPDECEVLKSEIERRLQKKEQELAGELLSIGLDIHSETVKSELYNLEKDHTKALIDLKNILNDKQKSYIECLEKLLSVYEEILKLKFETFPTFLNDKVEFLQIQTETSQLKAELLSAKSKVRIFTETKQSLQAYKEILKDIQEEQKKCQEDIEKLKQLKEKYKQVSSKQYNEILDKYLVYKTKLDSFK